MTVFEWRSTVPFPADQVYAWHARPGSFERLSPPWQRTHVIERSGDLEHHGTLVFEYRSGPLRGRWVAAHGDAEPGRRFSDRQLHGPFVPYLSVLDLLMNEGPASLEIIRRGAVPIAPPPAGG